MHPMRAALIRSSLECLREQGDVIELQTGADHSMAAMSCGGLSSQAVDSHLRAGVGTLSICARTQTVEVEEEGSGREGRGRRRDRARCWIGSGGAISRESW